MGRSRKRPSKAKGLRYQAVAYIRGQEVPLGTYTTKELADDAWQYAEAQERRRTGGSSLLAGRMKFKDLVPLYFAQHQLEASTRKAYRTHCHVHLLPEFGDYPIADIDAGLVGEWMNGQVQRQVSLKTRVDSRITLSSILEWAKRTGRLSFNPVHATRAPKKTQLKRRRTVLKPEQWPALRRELNEYGPEIQLMIDLQIDTGLRFGEQSDLRPAHVVMRHGKTHLKVETVVTWPGEENSTNGDVVERKFYTKGVEDRIVDLSERVAEALHAHIARHHIGPEGLIFNFDRIKEEHFAWRQARDAEKRAALAMEWAARLAADPISKERFTTTRNGKTRTGEHGKPNTYGLGCRCAHCSYANATYNQKRRQAQRDAAPGEYLRRGPAPKGRPEIREPWLSPQWWGEVVWRPTRERAGLGWLHWHDLRHAHATWLLAAGVDVRKVQKRLGHANLATTEIYLGLLEEVEDVASFMGKYHDIFEAARRGELFDPEAALLEKPKVEADPEMLGEMLAQLPPEQLAALLTQALTKSR